MVLAPPRRLYAGVMQHQELAWERIGGLKQPRRRPDWARPSGTIAAPLKFPSWSEGIEHMATSTNQSSTETPVVRTTTQAREGVTGHGVRYVLVISTAAVVVIFVALWLFYFH